MRGAKVGKTRNNRCYHYARKNKHLRVDNVKLSDYTGHFLTISEPNFLERARFKRLGEEASAGAIADMLWKSRRSTNYGRLFRTNLI